MRVILIAASTLCGRISPAKFGSHEDLLHLRNMRLETDASIIGAGTLREENPEIKGPEGTDLKSRIRAIVSGSGHIPIEGKLIFNQSNPPIIFTSHSAAQKLSKKVGSLAEVVAIPSGPYGLSIVALLRELEKRGASSVLVEGGGKLNYSSIAEGVVDEIVVTITPNISGNKNSALLVDGPVDSNLPLVNLELLSSRVGKSGEIFARYRVRKDTS